MSTPQPKTAIVRLPLSTAVYAPVSRPRAKPETMVRPNLPIHEPEFRSLPDRNLLFF